MYKAKTHFTAYADYERNSFIKPKSGILLRFNLSGVQYWKDHVFVNSVALSTFLQIRLQLVQTSWCQNGVKLHIYRPSEVLTRVNELYNNRGRDKEIK